MGEGERVGKGRGGARRRIKSIIIRGEEGREGRRGGGTRRKIKSIIGGGEGRGARWRINYWSSKYFQTRLNNKRLISDLKQLQLFA